MDRTESGQTRYQALDAWRGVVCLIVVLEHAGVALWSGGDELPMLQRWLRNGLVNCLTLNIGAPLFFVISGYCIASSLDSTRRKGTSPTRFLARRLWRIFPPYWASVAIIGLLVAGLDRVGLTWLFRTDVGLEISTPASLTWSQWMGNVTLTETWRPLIGGSHSLILNRVAWALCYQEQFYLICFFTLVFAPKRLYGTLGAVSLAIVGYRIVAWDSARERFTQGLFFDLWHEFAVGLALYWRINVARSESSRRAIELGLVGLIYVAYQHKLTTTVAAAAFGLLLIGFHRWDDQIARIGRLDPLRLCGRRSYAIYLIHLPVCTMGNSALGAIGLTSFWGKALVMIPVVTAASVAAGWAFHALVDRRFGKLPEWRWLAINAPATPTESPAPVEPAPVSGIIPSWSS